MSDDGERIAEMTAQEKAAYVTFRIAEGEEMTTAEIARRAGVTWHGANEMMNKVSRVIPIYRSGGRWKRLR